MLPYDVGWKSAFAMENYPSVSQSLNGNGRHRLILIITVIFQHKLLCVICIRFKHSGIGFTERRCDICLVVGGDDFVQPRPLVRIVLECNWNGVSAARQWIMNFFECICHFYWLNLCCQGAHTQTILTRNKWLLSRPLLCRSHNPHFSIEKFSIETFSFDSPHFFPSLFLAFWTAQSYENVINPPFPLVGF